jgi:dTDP-4-amino-4,6-dideoxygalactose transaminase
VADLPIDIIEPATGTIPSWFGFAFLIFRRNELARYLDKAGIGNRPIMGGNITRQQMMQGVEHEVIGSLDSANKIHEWGMWVGCFQGLSDEQIDYTVKVMREFF